jgi:hypothetical protein
MKIQTTLLLLIITASCFSQIEFSVNEIDEFEGTLKRITKSSNRVFKAEKTSGTLNISAARVDKFYFIQISVNEDLGCLSEYDGKAMIKLTNGTIIECTQLSETDCDDYATASYVAIPRDETENPNSEDLNKGNLKILSTVPIEKIRVHGPDYYNDYVPNVNFTAFPPSEVLMRHLKALDQ